MIRRMHVGDCVEIRTGKPWKFEGSIGTVKKIFTAMNGEEVAVVEMDDDFNVRAPLSKLIIRKVGSCHEGEFE